MHVHLQSLIRLLPRRFQATGLAKTVLRPQRVQLQFLRANLVPERKVVTVETTHPAAVVAMATVTTAAMATVTGPDEKSHAASLLQPALLGAALLPRIEPVPNEHIKLL
jgi:hypothetical protein